MCGRFAQKSPAKKITKKFKVEEVPPLVERYNVAPTQSVLVVREPDAREAVFLKWGLMPRWAKDPGIGNRLINARAETVTEKPSFRDAFSRRRCLVPMEGFYEWARRGDGKKFKKAAPKIPASGAVSRFAAAARDRPNFGEPLDRVLVVPAD